MPQNTTGEGQSPSQHGWETIAEAAQLLRRLQFSHAYGAYAEGSHVSVSADPRWNADNETICVLITCYALGHHHTEWSSLPVYVSPEDTRAGVYAIARLDTRGQAFLPNLPPGVYHLSLRTKPTQVQPVLFPQPERLAAQGEDEESERQMWRGSSEEGALVWTIEETEEGDVQIAFETHEERLAGQVVVFSLVDPDSRRVLYRHRLTLEPTRTSGTWEGWCSLGSQGQVHGPYELVFEVAPADETQ